MVLGFIDERVFERLANLLVRWRVTPSHLTLLQAPVYLLQLRSGLDGDLLQFWFWVSLGIVLDGADGVYARLSNQVTAAGARLDAIFDLAGLAIVLMVTAVLHPATAVWCVLVGAANVLLCLQPSRRLRAGPFNRGPIVLGLLFDPLLPGAARIGVWIPLTVAVTMLVVPKRPPARRSTYRSSGMTMPKP